MTAVAGGDELGATGSAAHPELSVVIACFNGAATLREQLDSLARQTYPGRWELVVADNGSSDDSVAVCHSYDDTLPLRVVDASQHPGQAHARNVGGRAATGRSILFLDQDDLVADDYLERMADALVEHRFVAARIELERLNPPWLATSRTIPQVDRLSDVGFPAAYGSTMGIRRDVLASLGGFDPSIRPSGEDTELCLRAQRAGIHLVYVPDAVLHYRLRPSLPAIFRQGRSYGRGGASLGRKLRAEGWSMRSSNEVRMLLGSLKLLVTSRSRQQTARALFLLGQRIGRVEGRLLPR